MPTKHCQKPSKISLPDLYPIAKRTRLIVRESKKFTPDLYLCSLMKQSISGKTSLREIASSLSESLPGMSKQAMAKRIGPKSTAFLSGVAHQLMEQKLAPVREPLLKNKTIKRVVIEDSTALVMNKKSSNKFPAHGNQYGATAGIKVDLSYDLMSGQCVTQTIEKATEQDKVIGKESLDSFEAGDLILRDMGYFVISCFIDIEELGCHWLSRLPLNCNASKEDGTAIEKVLKQASGGSIDIPILLGDKEKHRCRLVAVRAAPDVASERRRNRRKKAKENKKAPCPNGLTRDDWHLMVTSLGIDDATVQELAMLYTARWSIELQFRGLKKEVNLKTALNRVTNPDHIYAITIAALIAHLLTMQYWNLYYPILEKSGRILSLEKLMSNVVIMLSGLKDFGDLERFTPDLRHIAYEKRAKRPAFVNQAFKPLG